MAVLMAVLMARALPRSREAAGARCTPPGQIPGLAAANAAEVTR